MSALARTIDWDYYSDAANDADFNSGPKNRTKYAYVGGDPISDTDPYGECPWCVGAVIGAGTDLILQLIANRGKISCVNWFQVGLSGAVGAVGGGNWAGLFKFAKSGKSEFEVAWHWSAAGRRIRSAQNLGGTDIQLHHWLIEHGSGLGRILSKHAPFILNHPLNLNPIAAATHIAIHQVESGILRTIRGAPEWAKVGAGSMGIGAAEAAAPDCCD